MQQSPVCITHLRFLEFEYVLAIMPDALAAARKRPSRWNLDRFKARGDVPGITKEQLEKFQAKY